MEKSRSKGKKNVVAKTNIVSPLFDIEQMNKTIANGIQMYLDQKPAIEEMIRQQAPIVSDMVKRINESARLYHSMFANLEIPKYLAVVQKEQERMLGTLRDVAKLPPISFTGLTFDSVILSPHKQKEVKEKIEEEIFEEIFETVEERSETIVSPEFKAPLVILPTNATWEDIKIVFKNRDDVKIYYKGKILIDTNCEKLGFARNNTTYKLPNKPWELLHAIAVINDQKVSKPTIPDLMYMLKIKNSDALHRVKLRLNRQLKKAFGLNDPFLPYKPYQHYKLKFVVMSELDLRNTKNPWASGAGLPKKYL